MSKISRTGDGLKVLIACEATQCHDWMTYSSWYSLQKNFPDAVVKIICHWNPTQEVFKWKNKIKSEFRCYASDLPPRKVAEKIGLYQPEDQVFIIDPWVMAVAPLDEELDFSNLEIVDAKEEKTSPFVSYFNGCCKFVISEWINKQLGNPFLVYDKLQTIDLTLNERRVLDMWGRCRSTYMVIS